MTHNRMTIEEYIEALRGALRVAQDFINTHNVTYMGEEYEDQRRIQFNAREFVRRNQIQATLDLEIPAAPLRPMSEAPVNTQLLEASIDALRGLYQSADVRWMDGKEGHDWAEAMSVARGVLTQYHEAAIQAAEEGK